MLLSIFKPNVRFVKHYLGSRINPLRQVFYSNPVFGLVLTFLGLIDFEMLIISLPVLNGFSELKRRQKAEQKALEKSTKLEASKLKLVQESAKQKPCKIPDEEVSPNVRRLNVVLLL